MWCAVQVLVWRARGGGGGGGVRGGGGWGGGGGGGGAGGARGGGGGDCTCGVWCVLVGGGAVAPVGAPPRRCFHDTMWCLVVNAHWSCTIQLNPSKCTIVRLSQQWPVPVHSGVD